MNIRENEEIENLREIEKLKIQHILNYNFWHNWEDNDEMKWIDNAYYDENELSRLKQTKLVKHGLRDLTAIVHGKYQYTRYTHPYYNSSLKSLQTDGLSNWNNTWSTYNRRPTQRCAAQHSEHLKHAP